MVKLKDIATACDTSIATVSKALHDSPELSESTKSKIKKTAMKMGYVPNAYAQALKNKKTYSIGVIFYDPTHGGLRHEYFSGILNAVKVRAEEKGYMLCFISQIPGNPMSYLQLAKFRNVDGIIIVSEDFHSPQIIELVNSSIPTVTIDYIFNSASAVVSDNTEGVQKVLDYVYSLGHRKIGFIHGELTDVTARRLAGFHIEMKKLGLVENKDWIVQGRYHDPKACGRATQKILSSPDKPTCILTSDDVAMMGAMTAVTEKGFRVPEDISLVGYDGTEISRISRPSYTTYVQNSDALGKEAVDELLSRIDSPDTFTPKVISVTGHLQVGQTTGKID